jgi:hypothetical protein
MIDNKDLEDNEMLRVAIRCAIVVLICIIGYLLVGCTHAIKKQSVEVPKVYLHYMSTSDTNKACNYRPSCRAMINGVLNVVIDRNSVNPAELYYHETVEHSDPELKEYEKYEAYR